MAFVTGSAGDLASLRTALINACTANGWTLSGEVLHKGNVFVRLQVVGGWLEALGGTGIDAGNLITGPAPNAVRLGAIGVSPLLFPATYDIHVHTIPDEVYCVVNYNVTDYQWMAFGITTVTGLGSTGMWVGASTAGTNLQAFNSIKINSSGQIPSALGMTPVLFGDRPQAFNSIPPGSSYISHGLNGSVWNNGIGVLSDPNEINSSIASAFPIHARQPYADGDIVLSPLRAMLNVSGNRTSLVVDCAHARLARIDNLEPRDVITLGADQWRVYPWFRKSLTLRDGDINITHTGTMGWAIRFDGVP